jgi:hypothetical protein
MFMKKSNVEGQTSKGKTARLKPSTFDLRPSTNRRQPTKGGFPGEA